MNKKLLWSSALLMAIGLSASEKLFQAQFTRNGWAQDKWQMVKSWRWDYLGSWIQRPDCIENRCPDVADKSELLDLRAGETYTAMLVKEKFSGNSLISCEMEFTDRMAPGLIIVLEPPVQDSKGRQELREHLEIILWDEGINVWHHFFVDGEQQWHRAAYFILN